MCSPTKDSVRHDVRDVDAQIRSLTCIFRPDSEQMFTGINEFTALVLRSHVSWISRDLDSVSYPCKVSYCKVLDRYVFSTGVTCPSVN